MSSISDKNQISVSATKSSKVSKQSHVSLRSSNSGTIKGSHRKTQSISSRSRGRSRSRSRSGDPSKNSKAKLNDIDSLGSGSSVTKKSSKVNSSHRKPSRKKSKSRVNIHQYTSTMPDSHHNSLTQNETETEANLNSINSNFPFPEHSVRNASRTGKHEMMMDSDSAKNSNRADNSDPNTVNHRAHSITNTRVKKQRHIADGAGAGSEDGSTSRGRGSESGMSGKLSAGSRTGNPSFNSNDSHRLELNLFSQEAHSEHAKTMKHRIGIEPEGSSSRRSGAGSEAASEKSRQISNSIASSIFTGDRTSNYSGDSGPYRPRPQNRSGSDAQELPFSRRFTNIRSSLAPKQTLNSDIAQIARDEKDAAVKATQSQIRRYSVLPEERKVSIRVHRFTSFAHEDFKPPKTKTNFILLNKWSVRNTASSTKTVEHTQESLQNLVRKSVAELEDNDNEKGSNSGGRRGSGRGDRKDSGLKISTKRQMLNARKDEETRLQELSKKRKIRHLADKTHFSEREVEGLIGYFSGLTKHCGGMMDRDLFKTVFLTTFGIDSTNMLEQLYYRFDADREGTISDTEWVMNLSTLIRGDLEEQTKYCFDVYDVRGNGLLDRNDVLTMLQGSVSKVEGIDDEEETAESNSVIELTEILLRRMDETRVGGISFPQFKKAVLRDPLSLQCLGQCLPAPDSIRPFLAMISDNYTNYLPNYSLKGHPNYGYERDKFNINNPREFYRVVIGPVKSNYVSNNALPNSKVGGFGHYEQDVKQSPRRKVFGNQESSKRRERNRYLSIWKNRTFDSFTKLTQSLY